MSPGHARAQDLNTSLTQRAAVDFRYGLPPIQLTMASLVMPRFIAQSWR
jgi:hypothetical protein